MVRLCRVPEMARVGPRASVRGPGQARTRPALGCPSDDPAVVPCDPAPGLQTPCSRVRPGPRLFSRSGECGAGKRRPGTSARSARSARSASWVSSCFGFTATSDRDPRPRLRPRASVLGRIVGQPAPLPRQGQSQRSAPPRPPLREGRSRGQERAPRTGHFSEPPGRRRRRRGRGTLGGQLRGPMARACRRARANGARGAGLPPGPCCPPLRLGAVGQRGSAVME